MSQERRHKWDHDNERRLAGIDAPDGNARNERDCLLCGMTRVTVIPAEGFAWHEWRTRDGQVVSMESTPPCVERVEDAEKLQKAGLL